jgi:hypothetical protein
MVIARAYGFCDSCLSQWLTGLRKFKGTFCGVELVTDLSFI